VIPLDVYLENERELFTAAASGDIADELKGTIGEKLLSNDPESKVVVNFHGVGLAFIRFLMFSFDMPLSLSQEFFSLARSLASPLLISSLPFQLHTSFHFLLFLQWSFASLWSSRVLQYSF
jgi:hypothetical protein